MSTRACLWALTRVVRKWKESTARATEGMTREEVLAYFDRNAVRARSNE